METAAATGTPAVGWVRRLGPWVGIGTSPAALMLGGGVAEGMEGPALAATLVAGTALLVALAVVQGILGQTRGMPLAGLVAAPLGTDGGRRVAAVAMLVMMVGWFGVNVGVAGVATARLIDVPDAAGVALFAALALATVWRGISSLSWAALAAGCATVVLAGWGLHLAAEGHDLGFTSARTATDPIGAVQGISLVVGFGAAFALRTPDFTRDLQRPRQVVWCGLVGFGAPMVAFALAGAALQAATGSWNLADVLEDLSSPTAAYLFVAIGFFGSVMTNIWSGALALEDASSAPRRPAMVAVTLVGTVLAATGFSDRMLEYLVGMAILAPGLAVLCWIAWTAAPAAPVRWRAAGLAAWALSVAAGLAFHALGTGVGAAAAVAVATVAGLALLGPGRTARMP